MTQNVGTADRLFRFVLGLVLLALPFVSGLAMFDATVWRNVSLVLGIVMLATAAFRFCPLYRVLGLHT